MMDDWRTASRYGLPFGVGLAIFAGGIGLLHAVNPLAQWRTLPYLWLLAAFICAFLAGFIAARARGSFTLGVDAGAVACAAPLSLALLVFGFGSFYEHEQADAGGRYLPGIVNAVIAALLLIFIGAACGAVLGGIAGIPGALLGRIQANLDGANNPPTAQDEAPADDEEAELTDPSAPDIVIPLSWVKGLAFLLLTFLFAAVASSIIRSGQSSTLNWIVFYMFGLGVPFALANLLANHPVLRFSEAGIAFRGSYFWLRGQPRWEDVRAIFLEPATARMTLFGLMGSYNLRLVVDGKWQSEVRLFNWQLPSSTPRLLHNATIRYARQIAENEIVLRGVE